MSDDEGSDVEESEEEEEETGSGDEALEDSEEKEVDDEKKNTDKVWDTVQCYNSPMLHSTVNNSI